MTQRENFLRTINFDNPEWMPFGPDVLEVVFPTDVVKERPSFAEGTGYDWFGVYWQLMLDENPAANGFSYVPGRELLQDISDWKNVIKFPDISNLNWDKADEIGNAFDKKNKFSVLMWESGPWERIISFMGHENALLTPYLDPDALKELMQAITDYKIELVEPMVKHFKPDMICLLEDLSHHRSPFFSKDMYKEFIQPYSMQIAKAIKDSGVYFMYHSCGNVVPLMEEILKMEPAMMLLGMAQSNDQVMLNRIIGQKSCIWGGPNSDIMALDSSTDEDIANEIYRCVDTFKDNRNLVFDPGFIRPERVAFSRDVFYEYTKGM